jgi:hypothetical protein
MARYESRSERRDKQSLHKSPAGVQTVFFKGVADIPNDLFGRVQDANMRWIGRARAEAGLASELISKLSSARSLSDAMNAYQDWGTRRFEMIAEDAKHVLDDTQTFMQAGVQMLTNGFTKSA